LPPTIHAGELDILFGVLVRRQHGTPILTALYFAERKRNPKEIAGNSSTDYTADLSRTAKVAKEPPLGAAGTQF